MRGISFRGRHFDRSVILLCVRWYLAYGLSLCNLEEMMAERGGCVDPATIHRWVLRYSPELLERFNRRKRAVGGSWHMDETYIKVRGQWTYLYRAIDSMGDTVEFFFSELRDLAAAKRFLTRALDRHGRPDRIVIDGSQTNREAILSCETTDRLRDRSRCRLKPIRIRKSRYLNNKIEQDHRAIKRRVRPMLGFKAMHSARSILGGIEMVHLMRKRQARFAFNHGRPLPSSSTGTVNLLRSPPWQTAWVWVGSAMTTRSCYSGHRYPTEVISHAVWLYFRFPLSLRMVEEMLAARGILVSHETVRQWGLKFGQAFANRIRRRLPASGDKWHLDEVVISIAGRKHWLWRAVDQHGVVLDILVQSRRNTAAAKRLPRKLLKKQGRAPRVMITDKLASYGAAKRVIMPGVEHRQHKGLNNRAENSHQPARRRERIMKRFKSAGQAQRFLAAHDQIANLFRRPANTNAADHRRDRAQAFLTWAEVTGLAAAA